MMPVPLSRRVFRPGASSSRLSAGNLYIAPSLLAVAWLPSNGQSSQVLVAEHLKGCAMFGLIWGVTARSYYSLRRLMPTNVLLDAIHTRRGLKWGVPAMLLAVPYALAAVFCAGLVDGGGSGWLNMLALLFVWNAFKLLLTGPVTLLRLLRVRGREAQAKRRASVVARSEGAVREGAAPEQFDEPVLASGRG
jgi:hypothetical protein